MNQIAKKQANSWEDIINQCQPDFNQIAVTHKLVLWKSESQFAIQALQKNKGLAECAPYTVKNAIINVAAVGLTLNPADGYAYLVPEYNTQTKQKECELRISFKGLMKVATDSGAIQWVKADVVKKNDEFKLNGLSAPPDHTILTPFDPEARGDTVGVYCTAKLHSGEYLTEIMSMKEITAIRACAKFDAVWATWFDEMAKKAVIKRASKQWPNTGQESRLHTAMSSINDSEGSDENYLIYTPEQEEAFNKAVDSEDALALVSVEESIAGGSTNEPGANSEICSALQQAYKERFRESKEMTAKGELIKTLRYAGWDQLRESRDEITECVLSGDYDRIQEIKAYYAEYELDVCLWSMLDEDTKHTYKQLKLEVEKTI